MRSRYLAGFLVLLSALAGCQSNSTSSGHGVTPPAEESANLDPNAEQLHDISGAILLYYAIYKQMPEQLTDLQRLNDVDTPTSGTPPLKFTSPDSGLPYLYYPEGLVSPDGMGKIFVCDATPSQSGNRWCIVQGPSNGRTLSLRVEALPEKVFQAFSAPSR
jgi:hypothetical protein